MQMVANKLPMQVSKSCRECLSMMLEKELI